MLFRSNDTATTEIYTLSLHDALPISAISVLVVNAVAAVAIGCSIYLCKALWLRLVGQVSDLPRRQAA